MNFTREPIIETIITPKEGYKLIVRNSKGDSKEEYMVDAIEVVSFGHSFFFRSMERPKSFLVPVSDYEVVEVKETRVVLKSVNLERAIKIGGGREAKPQVKEVEPASIEETGAAPKEQQQPRIEKKRDRRRHRRRRMEEKIKEETLAPSGEEGGGKKSDEAQVSSSIVTRLIPPPPGLIAEKFLRSKKEEQFVEKTEGTLPPETVNMKPKDLIDEPFDKPRRRKNEEETIDEDEDDLQPPDGERSDMQRLSVETEETVSQTSFSSLKSSWNFPPFGKIW